MNDGYKPQDAMQLTSSAHAMFQAIDTHGSGMVSIEQVQRLLEHLGPSFFLQVERLLEAGQMNKKMIDLPTFKLVIVPVLQRFLLAQEVDKLRALRCRLADTPHLPEESVGSEKGKSARRERAHADRGERETGRGERERDREAQDERASDSLGGGGEREGDRRQKDETNERGLDGLEGGGGGGGVGGFSPPRVYAERNALKKLLAASACLEAVCSWAPVSPTRRQRESATRSTQEETPEPDHVPRRKEEEDTCMSYEEESTCMSYEEEAWEQEHVGRRKEEAWERDSLRKFGPFQSVSEQERTLERGVGMTAVKLLGSERLSDDAAVFFRRSIALSSEVRALLSFIYVQHILVNFFWLLSAFALQCFLLARATRAKERAG